MGWFLLGRGSSSDRHSRGLTTARGPLVGGDCASFGGGPWERLRLSRACPSGEALGLRALRREAGRLVQPGPEARRPARRDCRLSDMAGEKTRGAPKKQAKKPKAPSTRKAQRQAEAKKARQQTTLAQ